MSAPSTLLWPPRIGKDGQLAHADQDSEADKQSCVVCILSYPTGWRDDNMSFGRPPDLNFEPGGADTTAIAEAIKKMEPRVDEQVVAGAIEQLGQRVTIKPGVENG